MNRANGAFILLGALLLFIFAAAASNGLSIFGYASSPPTLNPSNPLVIFAGIFLLVASIYVLRRWGRK